MAGEGSSQTGSLLRGIAASAGVYNGIVRVVGSIEELADLRDGEVLVVRASSPAWTVGMLRSGAIVAELGGPICHAAIIAREFGIPSVVAVKDATMLLKTGMSVTVDGTSGTIYDIAETNGRS